MARPDVSAMSLEHLLDEHPRIYRDGGRRQDAIRAEILRRFAVQREQIAALQRIIAEDQTPAGVEVARYRSDVERLRMVLRALAAKKKFGTEKEAADG